MAEHTTTGEPGRVPESSEVRNARVSGWLSSEGLYEKLLGEAREEFAKSGRGFWFASSRNAAGPVMAVVWVRAGDLAALIRAAPGGTVRSRVTAFVGDYDPGSQFVLLFEDPDGASQAFRLSPAAGGSGDD